MTIARFAILGAACVLLAAGCSSRVPPTCVSADAWITTPFGKIQAKHVERGDLVVSLGPDGTLGVGEVAAVHRGIVPETLSVKLSDERELWITPEHPVRVPGGIYAPARDLAIGDTVVTADGGATVLEIHQNMGKRPVLDFTVVPHPSYIANGVAVHNKTMAQQAIPEHMPGRYVTHAWSHALEITPDGGRLAILQPRGFRAEEHAPGGTCVWRIESWTLDRYDFRAALRRESNSDWLQATMPEPEAELTIRVFGGAGRAHLANARLTTPSRTVSTGAWVSMDRAEALLDALAPAPEPAGSGDD